MRRIEAIHKLRKARYLVANTDKDFQIKRLHKLIDYYKSIVIKTNPINTYHPFYTCL